MSRMNSVLHPTRRQFLTRSVTQSVTALAGLSVVPRIVQGMAVHDAVIPNSSAARRTTPNRWLPDSPPDAQFRALALLAMDVAKQAGADFADMRIGVQRECAARDARIALGYGIRAQVGGTWSFEHGTVLTPDAVAASARAAVAGARTASRINAQIDWSGHDPFAAVPVVTGEWHVPIEIDPFSVPFDDFYRMEHLVREPIRRLGILVDIVGEIRWTQETRVFASSEGSLVTQTFTRGGPDFRVVAELRSGNNVSFHFERRDIQSLGFESLLRTDFAERILSIAEEAIRWRELPERSFDDVGRFPVVFDGSAFAAIVGKSLNFALDGDRLSGSEFDASGRSFLQPFAAHPVQPPPEVSSLLTVTSDRAIPSSTAAHWDDDGVVTTPCTLVEKGVVVDFHTTRETAPVFRPWYEQRSRAPQLHGRSLAPTPASLPMASGGEVRVSPAASASEADLYRDMAHGFLIKGADVTTTSGLSTGLLVPPFIVEIVKGKPAARLGGLRLAFVTNAVLNRGLIALGDASTVGTSVVSTSKGMPWQRMTNPVSAPAASCKEVDIFR